MVEPLTPVSSLSAAAAPIRVLSTFEPSKPLIPRMLNLREKLSKTADLATHNLIDRLENENNQLKLWSKEQLDHLLANASLSWADQAWSYLETIASSVLALFNVAAGSYLIASNQGASGHYLIAAGVLNILHTVFTKYGMWDWIAETLAEKNEAKQAQLKMILPLISFLLSTAASMKGMPGLKATPNLMNILDWLRGSLSTATTVGGRCFSMKKEWTAARTKEIQGHLEFHKQNTDLFSRLVDFSIQETKRLKSTIKKPIVSLMQAATLAAQKV